MELAEQERKSKPLYKAANGVAKRLVKHERRKPRLTPETARLVRIVQSEQRTPEELDLGDYFDMLSEAMLWHLGTLCEEVISIKASEWEGVSVAGLRSMALGFGGRLKRLDLSRCPLDDSMVMVLAGRFFALRELDFSDCFEMSSSAMRFVAEGCHRTLVSVKLSRCSQLKDEAVGWLAGTIGFSTPACRSLQLLCLDNCKLLGNRTLQALAKGCRQLRSLNLRGCRKITDSGVAALAIGCKRLQVLSVASCNLVTDESVKLLAEHCVGMRSLNLSMVSKLTDESVQSFGLHSNKLQALNLAGCKLVSEVGICSIADSCRALQVLNVTGCEMVTQNGLNNLCEGLSYVQLAETYTGFKPLAGSAEMKLQDQLRLVKNNASARITALLRGNLTRVLANRTKVRRKRLKAITCLQRWIRGEFARNMFRQLKGAQLQAISSLCIQCCWRRYIAQCFTQALRNRLNALKKFTKQFLRLQSYYRGMRVRENHPEVMDVIRLRAEERRVEAIGAVTVRIQTHFRRVVSVRWNRAYMEELDQRAKDIAWGAIKIQSVVRMRIAKKIAARRKAWLLMVYAKEIKACTQIQRVFRGWKGRKRFQEVKAEHERILRLKNEAATNIERVCRGHLGRLLFEEAKRRFEFRSTQATVIQSVARMYTVPNWRQTKLEMAKAFIAQRSKEDALRAEEELLRRAKERELKLGVDSCSEASDAEDCPENDWQEHWDEETDQIFFFSPSRGVSTLDKYSGDDFEQGLVGMQVKFTTESDTKEYGGEITRFNRAKKKHRVQLAENKRVWINIRECETRVQIYDPTYNVWTMFRNYRMQNTGAGRKSKLPHSRLTQRTASWECFVDESLGQTYFYNVATGETTWELPPGVDASRVMYQ